MVNLLSSALSEAPIEVPAEPSASGGASPQPESNGADRDVERRLRAQYAEISQLAGGLAHEIRNPLSTLQLNLQLLAEDLQDPESPRERRALQRVERLHHEVQRLHGILETFLRFARVQDVELHPADLNEVVEELRDFYEPHAATKSIVIRVHLAGDLPRVMLEPDLFKQALFNLVLNAEHAMPSGGELILTTRRDGQAVVLDVTDTGIGMTDEVRAGSSTRSTRRGRRGAAWACRRPARSSRRTTARSTCRASPARAPDLRSSCLFVRSPLSVVRRLLIASGKRRRLRKTRHSNRVSRAKRAVAR